MKAKDSKSPRIRHATIEDCSRLHSIINAAYRTDQGWTTEHGLVKGERISHQQLLTLIEENSDPILVAEIEEPQEEEQHSPDSRRVVLVGCISAEASHLHPSLQLPPKSALIGLFSVDPKYQSRGLGSFLFQACLLELGRRWQCELAVLWVIKQRVDIQGWYERLGFIWTGEYRDFVMPENAVLPNVQFKIYTKSLIDQ